VYDVLNHPVAKEKGEYAGGVKTHQKIVSAMPYVLVWKMAWYVALSALGSATA